MLRVLRTLPTLRKKLTVPVLNAILARAFKGISLNSDDTVEERVTIVFLIHFLVLCRQQRVRQVREFGNGHH